MKEVSCRALDGFFKKAKKEGVDVSRLTLDLPYPLEHLRNRSERIEWSVFVTFMNNVRAVWSDEELQQIGRDVLRSPLWKPFTIMARALFSPADFYGWVSEKGRGGGNAMFSCASSTFARVGPGHHKMEWRLDPGYENCRGFFSVTQGTLTEMPTIVGSPPARIEFELTERGAIYDIYVADREPLLAKIKRWTRYLIAPLVARELRTALGDLQQRYAQLELARLQLAQQATQLRTAHVVSRVIHGNLDLQATQTAIAKALTDTAGFSAARVTIDVVFDGIRRSNSVSEGGHRTDIAPIRKPLESRGEIFANVELWPQSDADLAERLALLEFIVPTISMALDESLTFTALSDYRANLERKVETRTQELKEANDKLEENYAELKAAQEARDRIFANVNHELRTPLSLIMLGVEVIKMREGNTLAARTNEDLAAIEASGRRLLRLIDDLLAIAASQEGKLTVTFTRTNIGAMLAEMVKSWQPAAEKFNLSLVYEGNTEAWADVDSTALERMVTNLMSNAIKFTPAKGRVTVRLTEHDEQMQIDVQDTGIGLTEEFKTRVFGRFERGSEAVNPASKSIGLGLSLVKTLAEAHGGRATVDSQEGQGTTFHVYLPNAHEGANAARAKAPALSITASDFGLRPANLPAVLEQDESPLVECIGHSAGTVLVAEDDPELRRSVAELLSDSYRVIVAPDGVQALELAKKHMPDVLVSDVGMPNMNGYELAQKFRLLPGNRLAPIILLTAFGSLKSRLEGFNSGAVDYIMKPFDPEELRARLRTQLSVRDLALRLHQAEKVATLSMLSSGLAHEIRNPSNGIVNAIEPIKMLLAGEVINNREAIDQLLKIVGDGATQIRYLCRLLLGFGADGKVQMKAEPFDNITKRAIGLIATPPGITITDDSSFKGELPCAGPLISQVLVNLIENAIDACNNEGAIRVFGYSQGDSLIVEVSDTGTGVPLELRERIFDAFFTTKEPGKGTGLGLSTSREIVMAHGGTLNVSDRAPGATFIIKLPLTELARTIGPQFPIPGRPVTSTLKFPAN